MSTGWNRRTRVALIAGATIDELGRFLLSSNDMVGIIHPGKAGLTACAQLARENHSHPRQLDTTSSVRP